jgi:hypothetical protein
MSSPIPNTGNSSSNQTNSSEQSQENELFAQVFKSLFPFYEGVNNLQDALDNSLSRLKEQCRFIGDLAQSGVSQYPANEYDVIEINASDLSGAYEALSVQVEVAISIGRVIENFSLELKSKNERLRKELLVTTNNFNEVSDAANRYYRQVQDLSCELGIDADLGVDLDAEVSKGVQV